jgi:hypothetical protein
VGAWADCSGADTRPSRSDRGLIRRRGKLVLEVLSSRLVVRGPPEEMDLALGAASFFFCSFINLFSEMGIITTSRNTD